MRSAPIYAAGYTRRVVGRATCAEAYYKRGLPALFVSMSVVQATSRVLYLAQLSSETSNTELHQSLSALHDIFIFENPQYPVFIAYEEEDTPYLTRTLKKRLKGALHATEIEYDIPHTHIEGPKICFVSIQDFRRVPWPFSMYQGDYSEDNPYYSRICYRYMCRFWTYGVFKQPFMDNVTSYLRLDTDTTLIKMGVNPFEQLERERLGYLTSVVYKESARQTEGMWETFLRFAKRENIHPRGLVRLSNNYVDSHSAEEISSMSVEDAITVLYARGYNLDYIYNNWETSRTDIWKSSVYERLARFIDKSGGIIMRRWGDAPIRTLSLHLLQGEFSTIANLTDVVFKQYRDLTIFHKAYHQT